MKPHQPTQTPSGSQTPQHIIDVFKEIFRRGGGVGPTLKRALVLIRREGWQGLRRKWFSLRLRQIGYTEWIRRYDALSHEDRMVIKKCTESFAQKPLISVVMPTYNPKPEWLIEAIESVRNQLYPYWELCIADDASTDPRTREVLTHYLGEDSRIKVVFRNFNGYISAASNTALDLATGEYIALLDHDDLLAEHALFWVTNEICRHPGAKLIYSDEDKCDMGGKRLDPYFKCDWSADLFYSHNMISHLGVYQTQLVREIGGFRIGYEGAQDYDLALRCIEKIEPHDVVHIPRVLYHWRIHGTSTAGGVVAKPYALEAGKRAINEHLQRRGVSGHVESLPDLGMYPVQYALPASPPMASLIIPVCNGLELTARCLSSIRQKTTYRNYEILILDNGPDDPRVLAYLQGLKGDHRIRIIRDDRPYNFSALNNAAVNQAHGDLVGLINNDIEVISPEWLSELVSHAIRPEIGAVGGRLLYTNDTVQHTGVILGIHGIAGHAHKNFSRHSSGYFGRAMLIQSLSAIRASCLVIRKEIYLKVGGFNEDLAAAYSDIDFCLKVREAGYRNIYTPYAELYHHESATLGYDDMAKQVTLEKDGQYMKKRWGDLLLNDPAYNPNLTLDGEDFSLAWPPRVDPLAFDSSAKC